MSSASPYSELFAHLAAGGLVVLPSARAALTLRSAFDRHNASLAQQNLGPSAWEPARALSWQQYTTGLFNDLVLSGHESRLLLNEAQEHYLWRETISAAQPDALTSIDSLAELARSAFHLAAAFNATPRLASSANTPDTRIFAAWAADFTSRCNKSQLLSLAQLDFALLTHLQRNSFAAPSHLHLAAFDEPTPSQSALLDALRTNGISIIDHAIGCATWHDSPLRASFIAPTQRDELLFAAHWIRNYLQQHRDRQKSVAVLVPSLDEDCAQLDLIFREVLAPELESVYADLSSTPWQFAAGAPLASLPLIQCVLELAHWAHAPLTLDRISALLLSPFFGIASDRNLAAQFDASVLRRCTLLRPELDLDAFLALAVSKSHIASPPLWLRNVHRLISNNRNLKSSRTHAEWAEFLRALTNTAAWPGERPLTAAEFEATRAFDSVLDLLSTLDYAAQRVSLPTFLESLDRQARSTHFSGPPTHSPIQVMQVEDAAGSAFDAVLFLRATDANWPRSPRPNPLLSWPLQQSLNMPGASVEASFAAARSFTINLLARNQDVLFLSAAENAEGKLRPSPLLEEFSLSSLTANLTASFTAETHLEDASDDILLPKLTSPAIKGGAEVLKLQGACPFQAFAALRLQSGDLRNRAAGLNAIEGGNYVHNILQKFWAEVGSQQKLRAMSPADRDNLLRRCIDSSAFLGLDITGPWDAAYIAVQKQRLFDLLDNWLKHELLRSPFVVVHTERNETVTVGPLNLRVRIDRIDQLETIQPQEDSHKKDPPAFVYVDYKTGASGVPADWKLPRPDDPQLPLYALNTSVGELHAVAFAKVRSGESAGWLGYQSTPGVINKSDPRDIGAEIAAWRDELTHLADDFASGIAVVNPKKFPTTCKFCAQRLLCRVNPESFLDPVDETAEDDAEEGAYDE